MKKLCLLFIGLFLICLSGCKTEEASIKSVCEYYTKLDTYQSKATMNLYRNGEVVVFKVDSNYLTPNYFKVNFTSQSNNNEQIIVKNDDGVFVLTPTLNKQFKFDSDWPLNSSHAYLISAIMKDITNDTDSTITSDTDQIVIQSKVSHKVNQKLAYMKFTCKSKDYTPISCNFYSSADQKMIEVSFTEFKTDTSLTKDHFNPDKIMEEETASLGEGNVEEVTGSLAVDYMVEDEEDIQVVSYENRTVATYNGDEKYVVVAEKVTVKDLATPERIYDDFTVCSLGVVGMTEKSITFFYKNQQISIYSDSLDVSKMLDVAYSVTFA